MWYSQYPWNPLLQYILIAFVSYLLGSINGAIITSKTFYKKDIRGNAGLTNFFRVFGKNGIALVLAVDIFKTVIPVLFAGWLIGLSGNSMDGRAFAAFFCMLGHAYPVYYKFKGGKTVMTAGTAVWFVDWRAGLILCSIFVLVVLFTRYVSLGSVLAGALYPVNMLVLGNNSAIALAMVTLSAAILIYRHKENIKRLIKGTESKLKSHK
jgi:glycerol-3-phosphate acyltransferase PlsY